jgi:rod shape-determining protein MreC
VAPPSPRRPGFSRRAQYGLFAGYVTAIAGALAGLLLLVTARFDPAGHAALQGFIADIFSPVSSSARSVGATVSGGWQEIAAYFDAASKNRAMERELASARRELVEAKANALEVRRLKRLARLVERLPEGTVSARLVSSTGGSSRRYATFAAGSTDGVVNGQPVRTSEGLVGRIVQVGFQSARVLLIIDGGNIVPVKRIPDGIPALAYGIGDGRLDIRPLASGAGNPFKAGDVFVTSGTGGIYKPGIPVALGVRAERDSTIARPLADPASFDFAVAEPEFVEASPPPPTATASGGA